MKIVINGCYGGFCLSDEALEILGIEDEWELDDVHTDEDIIALIEEKGSEFVSGDCAELEVVELPENTTDYRISDYDGAETIYYVVDGKIHTA